MKFRIRNGLLVWLILAQLILLVGCSSATPTPQPDSAAGIIAQLDFNKKHMTSTQLKVYEKTLNNKHVSESHGWVADVDSSKSEYFGTVTSIDLYLDKATHPSVPPVSLGVYETNVPNLEPNQLFIGDEVVFEGTLNIWDLFIDKDGKLVPLGPDEHNLAIIATRLEILK